MKIKININKIFQDLIYVIVFFALIKPDSLEYIGFTWLANLLVGLDGVLMIILLILLFAGKFKISKMSLLIMLYFFIGFITTVINCNDLYNLLKVAGPGIAVCLLTDFLIQKKENVYFESIYLTLGLAYFLNFITILKYYPVGMYRMEKVVGDLYLMGYDNGMIYNLLPFCGVSLILSYKKRGKLISNISIFAISLTLLSEFFVKSASGIIEILIFLFLSISINNRLIKKIFTPTIVFFNYIFLSISINVFRIQNIFKYIIVDILNKDLTFTNRTYLWDYAINLIKNNPILGIGYGDKNIVGIYSRTYSHPHSLFLDIIVKGGIVLLATFIIILNRFRNCYKSSNNNIIKNIILSVICVFLIGEIINSVQYKIFFWSFLVLIEYADKITNKGDTNEK